MPVISRVLAAVWILAGSLLILPANAQTTTQISLDITVNYVVSSTQVSTSGNGIIDPFGSVTWQGVQTFTDTSSDFPIVLTFANGDTLQAESTTPRGTDMASFTIMGGTGAFHNATGSFIAQGTDSAPPSGSVKVTGSGSITTENTPTGTFSVSPAALTFTFLAGSRPSSQRIALNNASTGPAAFSASAGAESWLSVTPATGTAPPLQITSLNVTVNPAGLTPGTYVGTVTISDSNAKQFPVSITVTVNAAPSALALSQTSLRFRAAAGAKPPSQSIVVLNQGTGVLHWSASASTLSGSWLSVSPASGTGGTSATIAVDPANLATGPYYGLVQFASDGASNSPQNVVVVLNVFAANIIVTTLTPTGLIFVAPQGGSAAAQTVTVSNASNQAAIAVATAASQRSGLFTTNPSNATVSAAQPVDFVVTPDTTGLTPGVYTGILQFVFINGGTQDVTILVIVTPVGSLPAPLGSVSNTATSSRCSPTKLLPVSMALSQDFSGVAAWPTPLQIEVVDDCGSPMGPGDVVASFSTGDPSLELTSLGSGNWSATWLPRFTAANVPVVITVTAQSSEPALTGMLQLNGTLLSNKITPAIFNAGVVSTASYAPNAPLAPGAFASIFGKHLATATTLAGSLPLTTQLSDAQVSIGGRLMPVQYASDGQINVLIPYDLAPNSTQQIIVLQGQAYSSPEQVTIAPAQPAVFSQDQSGKGAGAITVVKANGVQFSADASHPASAGDSLVIYCAGLGPVTPSVPTGSSAPGSPPAKTSSPVTVTIGGKRAPVAFAGLTPTYAGLYQVNVTVPSGITPGPSVPVILTVAGLSSPPVTVAIQ